MRWHERLYLGEKAKKNRYGLITAAREGRPFGYYVLTPAANPENLLDLIPALSFSQKFYRNGDCLIVGLAADYDDAAELAGQIIGRVYEKTGGYDVAAYFAAGKEG